MNIPKMIDDYEIIKLEKETDKALFYSCKNKSDTKCLIKFYRKNKKPHFNSLTELNNPNAIAIYKEGKFFDIDSSKHFDYEIMSYLENASPLSGQTTLSDKEAFEIVKKIASCLNDFHKNGFIHRNVTPENILLNISEPILISYGCITEIDLQDDVDVSLTKIFKDKEDVTGTEGFVAPEVYTGVISPAVDYFCLGMTLYFLLTGKTLYEEVKSENFKTLLILGKLNDQINKNPVLTVRQKRIICGLITLQHDKRWGYDEITQFFNGAEIPVFTDWNPPEPFVFAFKKYYNVQLLSEAFLKYPVLGTIVIRNGKFTKYLLQLGLNGKANKIDKLINAKGNDYSSKEICSLVYLVMNDMKYSLCQGKQLKTKEDLFSLSGQLKKRLELLVLSKDILFDLWLSCIFDVNMKSFYTILEGDKDYVKSVAVNKIRHEKGLWSLLEKFLNNKEINIKVEPLLNDFFELNIKKIIKKSHCDEFRKNGNLLVAGKGGKYKVYNLIEAKIIFRKTFTEYKLIPDGYILGNEKDVDYIILQRGRKSVIQTLSYKELSKTFNKFLQNHDYKNLNALISFVFEYKHLKGGNAEFEKQVLSFVDKNHLEELEPFAKLYYFLLIYSKNELNTSAFIRKMTEIYDCVIENPSANSFLLINEMGKIYYQLDMKHEAKTCFEKGISFDLEKKMLNEIALALINSEQKKYKEALSYFRLCKKDKPELIYEDPRVYKYYKDCNTAFGLQV